MTGTQLTDRVRRIGTARLVALALGVTLFALAGVLGWQAHSLQQEPVTNRALIDEEAGDDVTTFVSRSLTQILSHDWKHPERTTEAADAVLSGQARTEYDTLFADLQDRAPGQKLTLTAEVQVAGIQELTLDKATVLVFLDQSSHRASDDDASVSAAQLSITVERTEGTWMITGLEPL